MVNNAVPIPLIARTDTRTTGLAQYAFGLYETLYNAGYPVTLTPPLLPPLPLTPTLLLAKYGIDTPMLLRNYPLRVAIQQAPLCHITSQNLATLLLTQRLPPTIVTVHDIYYLVERKQRGMRLQLAEWLDRLSLAGLRRARRLIAISQFTKETIIAHLDYPANHIHVIHRAVDTRRFVPQPVPAACYARYGLPIPPTNNSNETHPAAPIILFVGSEAPRKNIPMLIAAFARICQQFPTAVLVKAGAVHYHSEAQRLHQQVATVGITERVRFITTVPDDDLPLLYNMATVVVMPSLFEGFGLPALEAMACGTPVIASAVSSLPEVVGTDNLCGMLFDPRAANAVDELAWALVQLLTHREARQRMGAAARQRACTHFSQEQQARATWHVYEELLHTE